VLQPGYRRKIVERRYAPYAILQIHLTALRNLVMLCRSALWLEAFWIALGMPKHAMIYAARVIYSR
jgi:hypothetical protein